MDKTRACTNCSLAKAKCVLPPANDNANGICHRCSKYNLTCVKSDCVSKKRRGKATHAKVLEEKLDNIMSLLSRDREHITPVNSSPKHSSAPNNGNVQANLSSWPNDQPWIPSVVSTRITLPSRSGSLSLAPGLQISFSDADQILQEYTNIMLPQFPFVPLPHHNAYDMYNDTPLLLKTILWVTKPPNPETYASFEEWFRQQVAYQTVVLMEKTLELVQAILVFLAWKDIYFYAASNETSLVHLAIGMVNDLGLRSSCTNASPTPGSIVEDAAELRNDLRPRTKPTSDSRRTVLGVYYIVSMLCTLLGKRTRMEYTPFFDDCCKQLLQDQEYSTDMILVSLVRVQQIAIKVHDAFLEKPDNDNISIHQELHSVAAAAMRNELDVFLQQLPEHLKRNHLLITHYNAVRIRLFEPLKNNDNNETSGFIQAKCRTLLDCLGSTKTLCDSFRSMSIDTYPSLTFASILHLALAIIKALKLLCMEDHAWDLATARTIFNVQDTLQQLTQHFEMASSLDHPRCRIMLHGQPVFSDYAEAYRGIQSWYGLKLNADMSIPNHTLTESELANYSQQYEGFEFWSQLSDITHSFMPQH